MKRQRALTVIVACFYISLINTKKLFAYGAFCNVIAVNIRLSRGLHQFYIRLVTIEDTMQHHSVENKSAKNSQNPEITLISRFYPK